MADYTKSTNFAALRGSTPSDPAVFDTELAAVAVASATKLDKAGGTLTGSLTGTSASFPAGVTANITGNVTGSSGSCTGNAATATDATNATNATNATYATTAGSAVDATARATADAAVPKDAGILGVGTIIYARPISGNISSGSTVSGSNLYMASERVGGWNLTALSSGTWRNISPLTAEAGISSVPFQRIA